MDLSKSNGMSFREAWFAILTGKHVKLPSWGGYWAWENGTIMMHCRDGRVLDIRDSENMAYTLDNIASHDWQIVQS